MSTPIAELFEADFLSWSLSDQIADCDRYELAPLFLRLFSDKQPVLEAGCGSGRWCGWLNKHSIRSDGIDWSKELCNRASREIPSSRFIACDMKSTPLPDRSYGGVIALGSVEHAAEGPQPVLRELHRLLKPDGIAVITIPYGGRLRIFLRLLSKPALFLKSIPFIRALFQKPVAGSKLQEVARGTNKKWHPRFSYGKEGWSFFEYEFNKAQMREFLAETGFEIREEFVGFGDEGISNNFGVLAGKWNKKRCKVDFTLLGILLRKMIPVKIMGHMLCYVVAKKPFGG